MAVMRNTIKNHKHFIMTDDAPTARSAFFIIRACPTRFAGDARYGVTATKKTFDLAVHRNLAKRKLRDWIRHNERMMKPDTDYIFIARRAILDASRTDGRDAMRRALHYLGRTGGKK